MLTWCTMPKENFFHRTASTRPRKLIHHDMRESGAWYKGIINHSWTPDHIQNAHTVQEKHSYAMTKVSTFNMESLLHFYFKKKAKNKKREPRKNFQQAQQFRLLHIKTVLIMQHFSLKIKAVSLQTGWLANKPNCAHSVTPAFAQVRPQSQPSSAMDTYH